MPCSLQDYFSHTDKDGLNGPGWDMRLGLHTLSDERMLMRYGHVFTPNEISQPRGTRDEDGILRGGMPDNVPYCDVVGEDEYNYLKEHNLLER